MNNDDQNEATGFTDPLQEAEHALRELHDQRADLLSQIGRLEVTKMDLLIACVAVEQWEANTLASALPQVEVSNLSEILQIVHSAIARANAP